MYCNKFVAVVKCNGQVLREDGEVVTLPFGSDYSLLLKNLSSQRASINISIDGRDVLCNQSLILDANSETELKGFLNGTQVRNHFRFIQKTKEVQKHRGDKVDDGIIRIEYAFEKKIKTKITVSEHHDVYYSPPLYRGRGIDFNEDRYGSAGSGDVTNVFRSQVIGSKHGGVPCSTFSDSFVCDSLDSIPALDEGITVEGSRISQDFVYTSIGELEPSEVIILRLKGTNVVGTKVHRPVTVKMKKKCHTCGKSFSSRNKFCSGCGTSLEV